MTEKKMFNPAAMKPQVENPPPKKPPTITGAKFDPTAFRKNQADAKEAERIEIQDVLAAPLGPVKTWSFSALMEYESCPHASYLSRVKKCPQKSGPAADRGTKIHGYAEDYIQGTRGDIAKELMKFEGLFKRLREEYINGTVEVEGDWAVTRDWQVTGWTAPDTWGRMKLDAIHFQDDESADIYDWKTGKKFGNELKHAQQGMSYAIAALVRYPKLQFARVSMVYLDQGESLIKEYTRASIEKLYFDTFNTRVNRMTTATDFPPKANMFNCRWCSHAKLQEGMDEPSCAWRHEDV